MMEHSKRSSWRILARAKARGLELRFYVATDFVPLSWLNFCKGLSVLLRLRWLFFEMKLENHEILMRKESTIKSKTTRLFKKNFGYRGRSRFLKSNADAQKCSKSPLPNFSTVNGGFSPLQVLFSKISPTSWSWVTCFVILMVLSFHLCESSWLQHSSREAAV